MAGEYDWLGSLLGGAVGYMGSQGGNTTTQTGGVSPQFQPLAGAAAQRGMDIGAMPYTPYQYNTVAGFNPYQFAGMDMTAQRAQQQGGLPQQAESALGNTLNGSYLGSGNPYAGANPYLEQNIQNTMGDMTKAYNQQVAPTMAATAYKSGSFGNSGQQEMENQSRNMLQQNLGRTSADMRMADYSNQLGSGIERLRAWLSACAANARHRRNHAAAGPERTYRSVPTMAGCPEFSVQDRQLYEHHTERRWGWSATVNDRT
jgi:hypothetical protein